MSMQLPFIFSGSLIENEDLYLIRLKKLSPIFETISIHCITSNSTSVFLFKIYQDLTINYS